MRNVIFVLLFCSVFTDACSSVALNITSLNKQVIMSVPIYPVDRIKGSEGQAIQLTVPISTTGHALTLIQYRTSEEASYITSTESIFPTDIYISVLPASKLPKVFLARSPQSGCPVKWQAEPEIYKAYCDGSEFKLDGTYISGPSSRNLDEFPVSIREGMIWITNTIRLGSPSVSTSN